MKNKHAKATIKINMQSTKGKTPMSVKDKASPPKGYVEVIGTGTARTGGRFVRVRINGKKLLIHTNDLLGGMIPVYARLQNLGASLIEPKDQKDLHKRIKSALEREDTFPVATRIGWFREKSRREKRVQSCSCCRMALSRKSGHQLRSISTNRIMIATSGSRLRGRSKVQWNG
jgi:hypothetical protein